jgi:hypothetical protein
MIFYIHDHLYSFSMTATLAVRLETPPTAADIDRLALEFLALEAKTDHAYAIALALDEPHERMKERLIDLVEEFGSADHEKSKLEKSKLLHGLTHEMVATFGVSTSINAAAVDHFADVLRGSKQLKLLELIFAQTTRYHLRPDAGPVIRTLPRALAALYSQCHVTTPRHPVLEVRRIVAEE